MGSQVKVINVDQGDCLILNPCDECKYDEYDIFVDVGNGRDVSDLGERNQIILLLSHAHVDHIGGLSYFFAKDTTHPKIKELWLPFYYDEIVFITKKILSLKGIDRVSSDLYAFHALKDVVTTAALLGKISKTLELNVYGLAENINCCNHMAVYNPPLNVIDIFGTPQHEIDSFIRELQVNGYNRLRNWFHDSTVQEMMQMLQVYLNEPLQKFQENLFNGELPLYSTILPNDNYLNFSRRVQFIAGMLYRLRRHLDGFAERPNNSNFTKIYNELKLTSNDASVVFQYRDSDLNILFTGDVGKKRLSKIVQEHRIRADILKIPHHGSKNGISKEILQQINPAYAIVSHGNRKFGRSSDPHPHQEVIKLLDELKIETLYTNNVQKNNIKIKSKPSSRDFTKLIKFEDWNQ